MQRHTDGADSASPEHSVLACCKYSFLASEELTGNTVAAGTQGSRDIPKDITKTGGTNRRDTGTREQNGQRAPLARCQPEDKEEERGTPERKRA